MCAWIGKFAQQVKALAAKPEDLMLLPESYVEVDRPRHGGIRLSAQPQKSPARSIQQVLGQAKLHIETLSQRQTKKVKGETLIHKTVL